MAFLTGAYQAVSENHGPVPPIRARNGPGLPPGPVPAARFRENEGLIRVPGDVFTSEKVRPYLAAFGRPISSSYGIWHVDVIRRRFFGGPIRASGHTIQHTVFSDGELSGKGRLVSEKVQKMLHFYTVF